MSKGFITIVLHAHLPYVRHPEFEEFMEERWLFEAISETYIPLLKVFDRLLTDNVNFKITMSITPPLMEMLDSKDLQEKYIRHLEKTIELCQMEVTKTKNEDPLKNKMAEFYLKDFSETLHYYKDKWNSSLIEAFKYFQEKKVLEIITCNATHGFLPLLNRYPRAVKAQIKVGADTYRRHIGNDPKGMWLAECGYTSGIDKFLAEEKIKYFFVDSHGILYSDNVPRYGVYRPIITENGVFAFGRDPESSEQVWSAQTGYPGDFRYREFYRDVGYDREEEYIKPFIDRSGVRVNTGIKYHKITGKDVDLGKKEFYQIEEAFQAAKEQGMDFAKKKSAQIEKLFDSFNGVEPIIVAPFDAELFGHWWFEGPKFIEEFFRAAESFPNLNPITPPEFIEKHLKTIQITTPADSTWGANGYNEVWLNGSNDWIYPHLDQMAEKMSAIADQFKDESDPEKINALNQAARELLLAQSSDWAFIMTTGTTVEYASNRTKQHISRFNKLVLDIESNSVNSEELKYYEWIDGIFPDLDFRVYCS